MNGYRVETGALVARAGVLDSAAEQVGSAAGAVRGIGGGDLPPHTGAALEAALAAWPAALRRLAVALHGTGSALRASAGRYQDTDDGVTRAARGR
jgi:uncharacterized protein YukE